MKKYLIIFLSLLLIWSCEKEDVTPIGENPASRDDYYYPVVGHENYDEKDGDKLAYYTAEGKLPEYVNSWVKPPGQTYCHFDISKIEGVRPDKKCIKYDRGFYGNGSGDEIASYIREEAKNGTAAKKKAFFKTYGPLAVKIQNETGYPASALLSQWAIETAWGTSRLIRKGNGIGGHSCFKKRSEVDYPLFKVPGSDKAGSIKVECTYPRPSSEGGYYFTFKTLEDSAYAQIQNLLYKPGTKKYYNSVRNTVFAAKEKNEVADPFEVIEGLGSYAAFPPAYRNNLKKLI
ncbi:MAG: hypothetical protein HOM21_05010, partial [Halobacteriovoraceae bacterium]|nr:hypothetical protein [Halobacteriovoraceae bacterium]